MPQDSPVTDRAGAAGPPHRPRARRHLPGRHCELNFTSPLELLVATILSAQTTDLRVNQVTPDAVRALPDARRLRRPPTGPSSRRSSSRPASSAPRPTSLHRARRRRCATGSAARCRDRLRGPGHPARGRPQDRQRGARQRVRRARASPSTPTSAGCPGASAGPRRTDPEKVEEEVGALFPQRGLDDAVAPHDLARPAGVPRPQARLRGLRRGRGSARPTARARPTRWCAAKLVKPGPFS